MSESRRLYALNTDRETVEVLRAVLSREGTQVTSVNSWQQIEADATETPDQVVLMKADKADTPRNVSTKSASLPCVMIGDSSEPASAECPSVRCVDELFEFPELLEVIDSLWNRAA